VRSKKKSARNSLRRYLSAHWQELLEEAIRITAYELTVAMDGLTMQWSAELVDVFTVVGCSST
jgi:hypothetical protein